MNWVDIVILVLVLGLGFMGWRNGVIRWAFTLVGGIVGVVLAGQLYKTLAPAVPFGDSDAVKQLIAFGVIFAAVMIGAWIAARIVKATLNILLLGWVDSVAGLGLGLVVGAVAATAIISVMGSVPIGSVQDAVEESTLAEPLSENLGFVRGLLPSEFDQVKDLFEKGKRLIDTGGAFLERSQQLQELLDQGGDLLERSDRLRQLIDEGEGLLGTGSGFAIEWTAADDYAGSAIYVVFEPRSDDAVALGPLSTTVKEDGTARLEVPDGIDGDTTYDIWYFVDGNDNAICDEDDADAKRHETLDPGTFEIATSSLGVNIGEEGVCDHLG